MLTLLSWNINGIRAAERKGFIPWLLGTHADIICLQETKARTDQLSASLIHPDGFASHFHLGDRPGYSGVGIYTRIPHLGITTQFGDPYLDAEGRVIRIELPHFYLYNVYFPNGGNGIERLTYKLNFYTHFLAHIEQQRKQKPIIITGDINTAHREIDLARPKENANTSGFLPIERAWLDQLEAAGYTDTFRSVHGDIPHRYTWWDTKTRSRDRNIGWRLDYFWVSKELKEHIADAWISAEVPGSDHAPVGLKLNI